LVNFLREWRDREHAELPYRIEHTAIQQGRCQVLKELLEFIEEAPEYVAKS